jgi:two-component system NtrC family response regulator/two-component system response regulator HydG
VNRTADSAAPSGEYVLLIGDEPFLFAHAARLRTTEVRVLEAADGAAALLLLESTPPVAAVVGMRAGHPSGLATLEELLRVQPRLRVVMAGANPTVAEAVRVMQLGADAYVPGNDPDGVLAAVRSIQSRERAVSDPDRARRLGAVAARRGLVGDSKAMRAVLRQVALVAPTRTTVLLLGETGTGKERVAQAIHQASPRRGAPFIALNCAALTETVLESELFGHERGSFSGAHCRREGRFKAADGGTLFLDEIGEISPAIQVKLLRVLQERQFERVGGNETLSVDVRILAASNRDLRRMVAEKSFRVDLFYRLNVMAIPIPPLRERLEDLPALLEHILPRLAFELAMPCPSVSPEAMAALRAYAWPGNVRELENVIERVLVTSPGRTITPADLPAELAALQVVPPPPPEADGPAAPRVPGAKLWEIERHAILTTYEATGHSPARTAEMLGISLRTVHYRLREYRGEKGRRTRRPQLHALPPVSEPLHIVHSLARLADRQLGKS